MERHNSIGKAGEEKREKGKGCAVSSPSGVFVYDSSDETESSGGTKSGGKGKRRGVPWSMYHHCVIRKKGLVRKRQGEGGDYERPQMSQAGEIINRGGSEKKNWIHRRYPNQFIGS